MDDRLRYWLMHRYGWTAAEADELGPWVLPVLTGEA